MKHVEKSVLVDWEFQSGTSSYAFMINLDISLVSIINKILKMQDVA